MNPFMRKTLAIALLAGSALSVVPALAQTQAPSGSAAPVLPRQGSGGEGSSGAATPGAGGAASGQSQPSQDMGATAQQPRGSATGDGSMKAESQGREQRLKPQGDSAQQKPDAQSDRPADRSTTASGGSGSETRKPAASDSARQNNGAQPEETNRAATDRPSNETTGSINISAEQRTEVRNIFVENKVEPANVDVEVNVGVAIPTTVELHPLPPRIVEIVPAYRGYEYFVLADGRIIIVQPATHEVVYILAG